MSSVPGVELLLFLFLSYPFFNLVSCIHSVFDRNDDVTRSLTQKLLPSHSRVQISLREHHTSRRQLLPRAFLPAFFFHDITSCQSKIAAVFYFFLRPPTPLVLLFLHSDFYYRPYTNPARVAGSLNLMVYEKCTG